MATVFIAVECFECSTMQVKQRKKSSNKWNCVVCNKKQSVRKVFSQGFMAKDVRKFVQSFNMSRHFVQELQEETLVQQQTENQPRTDWSHYIDPDINDFENELCGPNVVTELPKPLFKKPKLRNNYSASGLELQRPVFGKRNVKKRVDNPGQEPGTIVKQSYKRVGRHQHNNDIVDHCSVYERSHSKMANIMKLDACDDDVDHGFTVAGSSPVMVKLKRPVSKWNDFIDDDADGWQLESRREEINYAAFETKVNDEIVEDDVHPDFM